ncbi:MAG: hypothetical protein HOP33_21720 [Verrucomicrobia bacterium]|nr:hypothetical protein [Verrucomicrobiota bacterium]
MWFITLIFSTLAGVGFIAAAMSTQWRFVPEPRRKAAVLSEWPWFVKGFVLPLILWALMNIGLSQTLQPFMPNIQAAQNAGRSWTPAFLRAMSSGIFIVSTYWAAVTMSIVLFQTWRKIEGETRDDFRSLCLTSLCAMTLPVIGLFWIAGWPVLGLAAIAILLPIVGYGPTLLHKVMAPPMYSSAIAKMKFGKYAAAEQEIIKQLEGREHDFEGWLMLATLYAEQFNDLPGAEEIIMELCDQPAITPPQMSVALHKLADWYLKIGANPDAAARALLVIVNRLPSSHLARMAEARRFQLPRSVAEMKEQKHAHKIALPSLNDDFEKTDETPPSEAERKEATERAKQLSIILTDYPNDTAARERLARLFTEKLSRADLGIGQVELLLQIQNPPGGKRAEWLGLLAAWKLRHRHDKNGAREILERIVREFPDTPHAFAAQRRLGLMEVDARIAAVPPRPKIIIRRD